MADKLQSFLETLQGELFPLLYAMGAEKTILRMIRDVTAEELPADLRKQLPVKVEVLERCLREEKDRKRVIEEKARANLLAITLAVSFFSGNLNTIRTLTESASGLMGEVLWAVFFGSFAYLLAGGFAALRAIKVAQVWDLYAKDEGELVDLTEDHRKKTIIQAIAANQNMTLIRSNLLDASYGDIRNGIALVGMFTLVVGLLSVLSAPGNPLREFLAQTMG